MPVTLELLQLNIVSLYESIKCYVIAKFFTHLFYYKYCGFLSFNKKELVSQSSYRSNVSRDPSRKRGIIGQNKRYYSTSALRSDSELDLKETKQPNLSNKIKSPRKNLSSPESRPYPDLYKGRGIPINAPE